MTDSMELGVKLVLYSDSYRTQVVGEITGFNNAQEAAHFRDNSEYADQPSELHIDHHHFLDQNQAAPLNLDLVYHPAMNGECEQAAPIKPQVNNKTDLTTVLAALFFAAVGAGAIIGLFNYLISIGLLS